MNDNLFGYEAPAQVLSPCVNVCRLDDATGWCIGCGRTGDEIARWTAMGDAERAAMLRPLGGRMTALRNALSTPPHRP